MFSTHSVIVTSNLPCIVVNTCYNLACLVGDRLKNCNTLRYCRLLGFLVLILLAAIASHSFTFCLVTTVLPLWQSTPPSNKHWASSGELALMEAQVESPEMPA